jgi:hypothetical protein
MSGGMRLRLLRRRRRATMKSPSSRGLTRQTHRLRLRVPWLLEVESEGLVAVVGGLALAAAIIVLAYIWAA